MNCWIVVGVNFWKFQTFPQKLFEILFFVDSRIQKTNKQSVDETIIKSQIDDEAERRQRCCV